MGRGRGRGRGGQTDRGDGNIDERNISWGDIKLVQNLIERCLQHYMSLTEIASAAQVLFIFSFPLHCRICQDFVNVMLLYSFSLHP